MPSSARSESCVGDVHPIVAESIPLRAAIAAAVGEPARRGELETTLEIELEDAAGWAALLVSLTRELVANVAEHADARQLGVSLRREGGRIVLQVADDEFAHVRGAGFAAHPTPPSSSLAASAA